LQLSTLCILYITASELIQPPLFCEQFQGIFDRLEKDMDSFGIRLSVGQGRPVNTNLGSEHKTGSGQHSDTKDLGGNGTSSTGASSDRGSKKKRGKGTGSTKGGSLEKDDDNEESIPVKGKKSHRKNKDAGASGDIKHGGKKTSEKMIEENANIFPDELIEEKVLAVAPELEELGGQELDQYFDNCFFLS
jgi:E3 UFM1-protein ligase 1